MYAIATACNPVKPLISSRFQAGIGSVARMVELVDTLDLGSSAARREGSSPSPGTMFSRKMKWESNRNFQNPTCFVDLDLRVRIT